MGASAGEASGIDAPNFVNTVGFVVWEHLISGSINLSVASTILAHKLFGRGGKAEFKGFGSSVST